MTKEDPQSSSLRSRAEYVRELKPLLPLATFERRPDQLVPLLVNSLVVWGAAFVIGSAPSPASYVLCATAAALSLTSLVIQAHDLSHETIIGRGALLTAIEVYVWGFALVPRTVWRKLHNGLHHANVASSADPDRRFVSSEATRGRRRYSRLFFPSRESFRCNPLILCGTIYIAYMASHLAFALGGRWIGKPSVLPAVPQYSGADRRAILLELLAGGAQHVALFMLCGGDLRRYGLAVVFPAMVSSTVVMHYIFTQHSLARMTPIDDPLVNSTSLRVPRLLDALHHHVSHHVEHHLFPRVSTVHYPQIRRLLEQRYPGKFRPLSLGEALRAIWKVELFADVSPSDLERRTLTSRKAP